MDKKVTDIFISYAHQDAGLASRLHEQLLASGFQSWMDVIIAGGERYTDEIDAAIRAARIVVVVVSKASNNSQWVRRELLFAQQLGKRIIPVHADDEPLPLLLSDLHALALHQNFNAGFDKVLDVLRETEQVQAQGGEPLSSRSQTKSMAGIIWLFVGIAVIVILGVVALRSGGLVAEILATGLLIGGVLLAMAWKADDTISVQFKRDLGLWLDGLDPQMLGQRAQRWPAHFAALFDRVFGKKHLSWSCFFRSSLASILALLICTLIWIQVAPYEWDAVYLFRDEATFKLLAFFVIVMNVPLDYLSLLETRWIIKRMQSSRSVVALWGWLMLDFVATTAVFFLPIASGVLINPARSYVFFGFIEMLMQWSLLMPVGEPRERFMAIPVWTTYFTTLWIWLYFLAQFLMRLVIPLRKVMGFLQYALPVEQRPLRSVGLVMALVASVGYCLVMLLT